MSKRLLILALLVSALNFTARSQGVMSHKGQLSAWGGYNPDGFTQVYTGARYITQYNFEIPLKKERLVDFEASANLLYTLNFWEGENDYSLLRINPYRLWARYSSKRFELRGGLQKINFGSASLLRPLMWFDQIDPRDPLRLTNGVYGLLGRYYFKNNANLWLWGLYGNDQLRGWEQAPTQTKYPEAGGRLQIPTRKGEFAMTYHFRTANLHPIGLPGIGYDATPEHKVGIDGKWDLGVGIWTEIAYVHKRGIVGPIANQLFLNFGLDYTFPLGNGLNVIAEQLTLAFDDQPFEFRNTSTLTAMTLAYPIGLFDNLSAVVFYDWRNKGLYRFVNWQRQFDKWSLYVMAYWNPEVAQNVTGNQFNAVAFGGKGLQIMLVHHH